MLRIAFSPPLENSTEGAAAAPAPRGSTQKRAAGRISGRSSGRHCTWMGGTITGHPPSLFSGSAAGRRHVQLQRFGELLDCAQRHIPFAGTMQHFFQRMTPRGSPAPAQLRAFHLPINGIRSPVLEAGPADRDEVVVFVHANPGSSWTGRTSHRKSVNSDGPRI